MTTVSSAAIAVLQAETFHEFSWHDPIMQELLNADLVEWDLDAQGEDAWATTEAGKRLRASLVA